MELMNRWFTRYLYGVENGVEKDSKSWIVREDKDRRSPTEYADYPHPEATAVTFYPQAGGMQLGPLEMDSCAGQGKEKLVDNYSFSGAVLAKPMIPLSRDPSGRSPGLAG